VPKLVDPVMTLDDVAAHFGVCRRTVQRWIHSGFHGADGPVEYMKLGRSVRFTLGQLLALERQMTRAGYCAPPARRRRRSAA
jgi:hypothetical protein